MRIARRCSLASSAAILSTWVMTASASANQQREVPSRPAVSSRAEQDPNTQQDKAGRSSQPVSNTATELVSAKQEEGAAGGGSQPQHGASGPQSQVEAGPETGSDPGKLAAASASNPSASAPAGSEVATTKVEELELPTRELRLGREQHQAPEEADTTVVVEDPSTPVIPEREFIPRRAYQLHWEVDVSLFAVGAALSLGRQVRSTNSSAPAYCTTVPEGCDRSDLSSIDRPFAGRYDSEWSDVTDYAVLTLLSAPWPMLWANNSFRNTLNDLVVIYESALVAVALSSLATLSASRARPFVYGTKAPEEVRNSPNGALSFVSGHTTLAFALSTSTFWTIHRRHGSASAYSWITLGAGTAIAALVGTGRVLAGKHFPTDVITGAAVGSAVATLLPALHDKPIALVPKVDKQAASLQVLGRFW